MTSIRITDNGGTTLETINGEQQFRVEVQLDSDAEHPATIDVNFSWDDGDDTDSMTLAHVKDGRYRSSIITTSTGGEGGGTISGFGLEVATGGVSSMDVGNGEFLTVTYDDDYSTRVRSFKTFVQQGIFLNRMFISSVRSYYTTLAMNLSNVIRALETIGEANLTDEGKELLTLAREGIQIANTGIEVTGRGIGYLNNSRMLDTQRFHIANWYVNRLKNDFDPAVTRSPNYTHSLTNYSRQGDLGISEGEDDAVRKASEHGRQHAEDVMWRQIGQATLGAYQLLVNATGAAQVMTLFGTTEMGKKAAGWQRLVAFFDLVSQAAMMGAMMRFQVTHTVGNTQPRLNRSAAAADPETATIGARIDPGDAGITNSAAGQAQLVARKHGVHILTRQSGRGVAELRTQGYSPKPMDIKSKTINELDVHLGAPGHGLRQVGHFDPQMPATRPAGMDDATWAKLGQRYQQRRAEYDGPTGQKMEKLIKSGKVEVRDGVVYDTGLVQNSGKPITGDYDLFEIVYPNGTPVPKHVYDAVVADLSVGPFQAMHGAHMRWKFDMGDYNTFAEFMHAADTFDTNLGIYNKIVRSHHQEPLVVFGGDRPPYALPSETAPPIKLGDINVTPGPRTGYNRVPLLNPSASLRYGALPFLDPDEAAQLQLADENWQRATGPISEVQLLDLIDIDPPTTEPSTSTPRSGIGSRFRRRSRFALAGVGLGTLAGLGGCYLIQNDSGQLTLSADPDKEVTAADLDLGDTDNAITGQTDDTDSSGDADVGVGPAPIDNDIEVFASGDFGTFTPGDTDGMRFAGSYSDILRAGEIQSFTNLFRPLSNNSVGHSDGVKMSTPDGWARFDGYGYLRTDRLLGTPEDIFGAGGPLGCGSTRWDGAMVLCPFGEGVPTTSNVGIFRATAGEPFPTAANPYLSQIGFAFQSNLVDGEYGNDSFPADFFIPANGWISLDIDQSGTFFGQSTTVGGPPGNNSFNPLSEPGIRVVQNGQVLDIIYPESGPLAGIENFRGSLFKHTGDFGQSGGPWHGDLTSTVADGMLSAPPVLEYGTDMRWWVEPGVFAAQLSEAFEANDTEAAVGFLHSQVFEAYTADACTASIDDVIANTSPVTVLAVRGPFQWDWEPGDQTVTVPLALDVLVEREINGEVVEAWSHFGIEPDDGRLGWFTFCE